MTFLFQNTLSRNTYSSYDSGTTSFVKFCIHYRRLTHSGSIIPASEETILLFASYLSQNVRPSTIKVYLAAVRNLHIQHGFPSPVEHSILLPRLLRGIKRVYTMDRRPRLPITPSLLLLFRRHLNTQWFDHTTLWAAMLVAFFAFLRSAELLALRVNDIQTIQPPNGSLPSYTITLQTSKTDPFRKGCTLRIAPSGHPVLCPARALQAILHRHSTPSNNPLFTLTSGQPLRRQTLNLAIKHLASMAGIQSASYSSHSFRISAATTAAHVGLPDSLIKTLGRWCSDAYQSYIHTSTATLEAVPQALVSSEQ